MTDKKQPIPCVASIVLNKNHSKTVFTLRLKEPEKGQWSTPGGKIDWGESHEEAAIREAHEELGVKVKVLKLVGITNDYNKELGWHYISLLYVCEFVGNENEITNMEPHKHEKVEWFDVNNLPKNIGWKGKRAIDMYLKSISAK